MKCTDCGYDFEVGDNVYSDGVKENICGDCLRDIVDMTPIDELANLLGYERYKFEGDNEEEKKTETVEQIPGQLDIWGGRVLNE